MEREVQEREIERERGTMMGKGKEGGRDKEGKKER
jgi:hypothetical protein